MMFAEPMKIMLQYIRKEQYQINAFILATFQKRNFSHLLAKNVGWSANLVG